MSIVKEWEGRTVVYITTCDICGCQLTPQYEFMDAVSAKRNAGWKSKKIDGEWIDLCPECRSVPMRADKDV